MKKQTLLSGIIISLVLICGILTYCLVRKDHKVSDNLENLIINTLEQNNWNYSLRTKTNSNDNTTILTEYDNMNLRISIDSEKNVYEILGYIDTIVPDSNRTTAIIAMNDYNNMGASVPGLITDYGLIVFKLWQHADINCFSEEIFMNDLFTTMYHIEYGTRQVIHNI